MLSEDLHLQQTHFHLRGKGDQLEKVCVLQALRTLADRIRWKHGEDRSAAGTGPGLELLDSDRWQNGGRISFRCLDLKGRRKLLDGAELQEQLQSPGVPLLRDVRQEDFCLWRPGVVLFVNLQRRVAQQRRGKDFPKDDV